MYNFFWRLRLTLAPQAFKLSKTKGQAGVYANKLN